MSKTARPFQIETPENDETFLQTFLNRMSPTPDPALVLKVALRFAAVHAKALSPELMLTGLRARGTQKAPEWVRELGQTLAAQQAMALTGLSKSALHKAKNEDRVFAVRLSGESFDRFPLFQFSLSSIREWVPSLLIKVGNGLPAAHFLAIPRERLQDRSYIDLLRERDDPAVIHSMLNHADDIGDESEAIANHTSVHNSLKRL
jgi:hypothetical protein